MDFIGKGFYLLGMKSKDASVFIRVVLFIELKQDYTFRVIHSYVS